MVIIEMVDARTFDLFKGEKGDSIVVSGSALRRIGSEGSVGATVNPDYPIRKKEEHRKCLMDDVVVKGKLASNEAQKQQLEDKIQSLTEK